MTSAPPGAELAAYALIRATAARDIYTGAQILQRWATGDQGLVFAGTVATVAALLLAGESGLDHDRALRIADEALEAYLPACAWQAETAIQMQS